MNKKDLISVVVPIYNVASYVEKCVESILNQTYETLQVILVNDGSSDNETAKICDRLAKKDKRIEVIHKKNGGLSDARNHGILRAKGKYISFIDGDDYVSDDFIETLWRFCIEKDLDIACTSYYRVSDEGGTLVRPPKEHEEKLYTGIEAVRDVFSINSLCEVMTWNKLYKRSLFIENGIKFPVGKIHEDNFTTYKLLFFADKVGFLNKATYYYVQRSQSIMNMTFNKRRLDVLEMPSEAQVFFSDKGVDIDQYIQSARLLVCLSLYNDYLASGIVDQDTKQVIERALTLVGKVRANHTIALKHKVLLWLAVKQSGLYAYIRKQRTERAA